MNLRKLFSRTPKKQEPEQPIKVKEREILNALLNESDKFYKEALEGANVSELEQYRIEKRDRLWRVGFICAMELEIADSRINQILRSEDIVKASVYFSEKYPAHKLTTTDAITSVCEKYNLVCHNVAGYLKPVSEEDLRKLEEFQIHKEDEMYERKLNSGLVDYIDQETFERYMKRDWYWPEVEYKKLGFEIIAPKHYFANYGQRGDDWMVDFITLKPVIYKNRKYYLIVNKEDDTKNL